MHRSWAFFCSSDLKSTYCVFCYLEVTKLWSLGGSVGLFLDLRYHTLQPDVFRMFMWKAYTKYPLSMHISMHNIQKFLDSKTISCYQWRLNAWRSVHLSQTSPYSPAGARYCKRLLVLFVFSLLPQHINIHAQKKNSRIYLHFEPADNTLTDLEYCKKCDPVPCINI